MSSILSNLMILLSVAVVFAVMPLSNVNGQYRVTNYNYSHGLDIFSINRIAEDSSGYIWLGSKNGFSRFDGLEFKDILSEVSISESDIGAEVSDIKVDRKGRIWMSFKDAGVSYYDPVTKQFTVRDYSPTDGENFPSTGVSELHFDHNQENVWIHSVLEGIFLMDIKTLKCRKFIKMNRHQSMIPDKRNPDYIYFSDRSGVWHLNIKTSEKVKVFHKELYNMIQKENMLYGCSYSSFVHRVNLLDKTFKTVKHINKNVFKGFVFYKNELWISEIEGVYKLDFENKSVSKPSFVDPQGNSMELSKVMGLSCDHDENLWIGTISGVSVIYKDFQQLTCLDNFTDQSFYDIEKSPTSDHYYAISYYGNEVFKVDLFRSKIEKVKFGNSIKLDRPTKILKRNNELVVAYNNGLARITKDGQLKEIKNDALNNYLDNRGLSDMTLGTDNKLYIKKSYERNIFIFDPKDSSHELIPIENIANNSTRKVINSNKHGIWLGTDTGIYHYTYGSSSFSPVKVLNDTSGIFSKAIEYINFSHDERLWMLSLNHGAYECEIDAETNAIRILNSFTKEDGLVNHRPWDMANFDENYSVFGAFGGMAVYNNRTNNILTYRQEQGMPLDEIYVNAIDNKIFVLSLGICYFEDLLPNKTSRALKVDVTPISLENHKIIRNEQQLGAAENDVSIRYNTVSMTYPRSVMYRYRLNKNLSWNEASFSNRIAVFNDLSPGEYEFEIQAKDRNSNWGPTTEIDFSIDTPIIQTWWFRTIMFLLFIGIGYLLYRYRINHVKKISSLKIKMNELENEALRAQMNPHFIFNSLNSIKSYIINNKKEEAADYLTTFAQLIRIVLENSKKRFVSLKDEIYALELYVEIEKIRLDDRFETSWSLDKSLDLNHTYMPPLSLQPFIENSIWHGFMHKNEKGELNIKMEADGDNLLITITDNGVGRKKSAEIEKSFGRKRSFGISITKERLSFKNKDSNISIDDVVNTNGIISGTKVTIKTPLITEMPNT